MRVYIFRQINLSIVTYLLFKVNDVNCSIWKSRNKPCVQTVQDRQGRSLLVLVLHVQKYKPLHCSQHAGGVSGQKAENTVERQDSFSFYSSFPSSYFPFSPKQICCLGRCFPVYLPLKHLETHRHMRTHTYTRTPKCSNAGPVKRGLPTIKRTDYMKTGEVRIIIHFNTTCTDMHTHTCNTQLCEIVCPTPAWGDV